MEKIDLKNKYQSLIKENKGGYKYRGFVILPHTLLMDRKIKPHALLIFWVLTMHIFKGKNYCFPSIDTIAKEARLSPRMARYMIKDLKKNGYLEIERKIGFVNRYYLKANI